MCAAASGESPNSPPPSESPSEPLREFQSESRSPMARRAILGYQEYLSPLKMGSTCRFDPTCSNYALIAFSRHGTLKGFVLTLGRLARCGPWHPGGWDPVPPRPKKRGS